jgi:hypothetical protein
VKGLSLGLSLLGVLVYGHAQSLTVRQYSSVRLSGDTAQLTRFYDYIQGAVPGVIAGASLGVSSGRAPVICNLPEVTRQDMVDVLDSAIDRGMVKDPDIPIENLIGVIVVNLYPCETAPASNDPVGIRLRAGARIISQIRSDRIIPSRKYFAVSETE